MDDYDWLFEVAETFNLHEPKEKAHAPRSSQGGAKGDRPGDHFNRRASWEEVLGPAGWHVAGQSGPKTYWRRPGKDFGWSATTGHCKSDLRGELLYVFSTSAAPLESEHAYSRFEAFALFNHEGNWSAAGQDLRRRGYRAAPGANGKHNGSGADQPPPGGAPPPVSPEGHAQSECAVAIILVYLRGRYHPTFKRGNIVYSGGREVGMQEACAVPTSQLIDRLADAEDAPRRRLGEDLIVNRSALPGFFRKWAPVAWGDLLDGLPVEDDADEAGIVEAADDLRRMVRDAMLSEVVLGNVVGGATDVERRSLIGWCVRFARPGPWRSIRSKLCWVKFAELEDGEVQLMVAIRQGVFAQLKADRRLIALTENTFARRCERYGVGTSNRDNRPHGHSAVLLATDFLDDLTAGLAGDDEDDGGAIDG